VQQFIAVFIVLVSLWGAVLFLKRKGFAVANAQRRIRKQPVFIEQLDRIRLTPQHSIHVLQVGEQRVVVAVHAQGVTVLSKTRKQTDQALTGGMGA